MNKNIINYYRFERGDSSPVDKRKQIRRVLLVSILAIIGLYLLIARRHITSLINVNTGQMRVQEHYGFIRYRDDIYQTPFSVEVSKCPEIQAQQPDRWDIITQFRMDGGGPRKNFGNGHAFSSLRYLVKNWEEKKFSQAEKCKRIKHVLDLLQRRRMFWIGESADGGLEAKEF